MDYLWERTWDLAFTKFKRSSYVKISKFGPTKVGHEINKCCLRNYQQAILLASSALDITQNYKRVSGELVHLAHFQLCLAFKYETDEDGEVRFNYMIMYYAPNC